MRGAAHLGVLSVLEEAGIRPSVIAGTSAGAIVGAGYAAGVGIDEMAEMARVASWREITGRPWKRRLSVFETTPLRGWIASAIGDVTFEELSVPLAAVTCNIADGSRVVLREGEVVEAAVASSAIPGLFAPVRKGDLYLVDGGLVDNLPVGVARSLGADLVIAVDVSPVLRTARHPEGLRDVMTSVINIMASSTQVESRRRADILVQPKTESFALWEFSAITQIIETGRQAALEVLPELLAAVGREGRQDG